MLEGSLKVGVGDAVTLSFTVTNGQDEPVEVTFRDSGKADFAVYDGGEHGPEVWRWSDGRMFAQALQRARFEPGEAARFEAEWPDPLPGDYTAEATLRITEADVTVRTPFSV
jgi:hypothetical protein